MNTPPTSWWKRALDDQQKAKFFVHEKKYFNCLSWFALKTLVEKVGSGRHKPVVFNRGNYPPREILYFQERNIFQCN